MYALNNPTLLSFSKIKIEDGRHDFIIVNISDDLHLCPNYQFFNVVGFGCNLEHMIL